MFFRIMILCLLSYGYHSHCFNAISDFFLCNLVHMLFAISLIHSNHENWKCVSFHSCVTTPNTIIDVAPQLYHLWSIRFFSSHIYLEATLFTCELQKQRQQKNYAFYEIRIAQ